ncbi:TonB-dependent receptor [Sphingopyxis sp. DHUNG17]|uniref:TonB-dependent receptor n=1 Tax=Sphingopyxis jiangsuensis TaxID=2871171 RepID=UPI00191FFBAA|nr:TonB-dependent receptor [Sphingopyxis lutea]MBL0768481.1 TonB-dependent receptor [Sphingopyxis lutea]
MSKNYDDRLELRFGRTLFLSASAVALLCAAGPAYAQTDSPSSNQTGSEPVGAEPEDDDAIVVTGFRRSLADALDAKRESGNIVDGINAEDIGKSADQNIAEALQRVTGVSIERNNGEGSTVTVRGVDANLNNVTLNGVTVTNAAGDVRNGSSGQAVDFSAFTSDILSRIEVAKTASADHNEGSLGATISLTTFKPLGVKNDRRVIDIQARYSPFADPGFSVGDDIFGGDYRVNLALSEKFANDTIGISLVATSEQTSGRTDAVNISRYEATNNIAGPFSNNTGVLFTGGLTNIETGQIDQSGTAPEDQLRVLLPFEIAYDQLFFETKRNNITGTVQWQPTSDTDIQVDATYTHVNRKRDRAQLAIRAAPQFFPLREGQDNVYDPSNSTLLRYRSIATDYGPGDARNPGYVRPVQEYEDTYEETFVLGFNAEHKAGPFTFNLSGGHSNSKGRDNDYIYATAQLENQAQAGAASFDNGFNGFDNRPGFTKGYDCVSGGLCSIFLSDTVPNRTQGGTNGANPNLAIVDDGFEFDIGSINSRDRAINDKATSLFFDVDWETRFGPIKSIEFGVKWDKRNRVQRQTNTFLDRFAFGDPRASILPFVVAGESALRDGFGEQLGLRRDSITDGIVKFDPFALRTALQEQRGDAGITSPDGRDFRDLTLEVFGGYALANFEFADGRIFGDVGGRWVKTNVDVRGGSLPTPSFLSFATRPENLAFFGYFGPGDPANTTTLADAQAAVIAVLGPDLVAQTDPSFVPLESVDASDTFSYNNFLPSLNLNWLASEKLMVRFAASQTMARPNIDRLRPNFLFNENTFANSFASAGNPSLRPFRSTNLDLSVEWYFDRNSLFSVALFNKQIKDAERTVSETFYIRDFRSLLFDANGRFDPNSGFEPTASSLLLPYTPNAQPLDQCLPNRVLDLSLQNPLRECEIVQFNRPVNAGSGYVRGVEVSLQHNFTYLPGILSGLGFVANYTYADSELKEQTITDALGNPQVFRAAPLPNTSNHTFNLTGFYEKDGIQLRVAYNWRSDYLVSSAPEQGGLRRYSEGYDSLDISGGFDITDRLQFNFQAVNLLDTVRRDYAVLEADEPVPNAIAGESLSLGSAPKDRTLLISNTGRIFRFGLRYTF